MKNEPRRIIEMKKQSAMYRFDPASVRVCACMLVRACMLVCACVCMYACVCASAMHRFRSCEFVCLFVGWLLHTTRHRLHLARHMLPGSATPLVRRRNAARQHTRRNAARVERKVGDVTMRT